MDLKYVHNIDPEKWVQFMRRTPGGNIFQGPEMYEVYAGTRNFDPLFIGVQKGDDLVGTLLAVIQKESSSFLGRFTSRAIIYGGPVIKSTTGRKKIIDGLFREYERRIRGKALFTQIRNYRETSDLKDSAIERGYDFERHLNYHLDLSQGKDLLWSSISKNRRKGINRAMKREGLVFREIESGAELDHCCDLFELTYDSVNLPIPDRSLFTEINSKLVEKKMAKYFLAFVGEEPVGARLVLLYKNVIFDYFAGSDPAFREKYPNEFLVWKILEWGVDSGFKLFDFGGAGHPDKPYGPREFKRRFGGQLVDFGRYSMVHKPVTFKIMRTGYETWKRMHGTKKSKV